MGIPCTVYVSHTGYLALSNSTGKARGSSRHNCNSKRVARNLEEKKSTKTVLTSAQDLTMEHPEGQIILTNLTYRWPLKALRTLMSMIIWDHVSHLYWSTLLSHSLHLVQVVIIWKVLHVLNVFKVHVFIIVYRSEARQTFFNLFWNNSLQRTNICFFRNSSTHGILDSN